MNKKNTQTLKLRDIPTPIFAQGFCTDKQMAAGLSCFVDGTITFQGGGKSTIYFGNTVAFSDIQKTLNVDVSGSLSIDLFSAQASASYAKYIEEKQYSQAFYYSETISLPTQQFQPAHYGINALNEIGQEVYNAGPQQFRDVCGDKLIQQAHLGATLIVAMMIDFSSSYDKQTFDSHAGGSWGDILSVAATIKQISTQYKVAGQMEFSAYQSGGDATELAKVFSSGPSHYYITSCSLSNLDACNSVIDGVLNYAANNLPAQIDFKNGTIYGSASTLSYTYMDVSQFGLNAGTSVLNDTIIASRQHLGDIYKAQESYSVFVNHILSSPFASYMATQTVNLLRIAKNSLDKNVALLENENSGAPSCYFYPTKCTANEAALMPQLDAVDTKFLDQMMARGFVVNAELNYCYNTIGESTIMHTFMFPTDNYSTSYFISTAPSLKLFVVTTETTLNIAGTSRQCPIATKTVGDSSYEIPECPCSPSTCSGGHCALDLGANYNYGWDCPTDSCAGSLIFQIADNPL